MYILMVTKEKKSQFDFDLSPPSFPHQEGQVLKLKQQVFKKVPFYFENEKIIREKTNVLQSSKRHLLECTICRQF